MAENDRFNKSLCEIPFGVTYNLMKSMDTDRGWEPLAAEVGFTFEKMQQLKRKEMQPDGSATRVLLWELGCLNYKVSDLYDKLRSVRRLREMQILEDYVKGGQESKEAASEKKMSEPFFLVSTPYLSSQVKSADLKPQGGAESGFSTSGSEINFNHSSFLDKSKAKVTGSKIIPGTLDKTVGSSIGAYSEISWPLSEADLNTRRNEPASRFQVPIPNLRTENVKNPSLWSSPHSINSSFNSKQGEQSSIGRTELLSKQGYSSSLMNKSIPSQSVPPNYRQTPSLPNKHQLETTASSSQPDNDENTPSFSYRELYNATDGFSKKRIIGEGAFGKVYLGNLHHMDCAIKKLHSSTPDNRKKSEQVKSELAALSRYRHENIVTLYGYAQTDTEMCLVYQYLVSGSLEDRLLRKNNTPSLPWERRLNILVGACRGLNFLHTIRDVPLIHGDIKSANILLDQYFEAKLGDLGQAKYASSQSTESSGFTHITVAESTTKLFGTKAYMPPELKSYGVQSIKSDVFSLGVVILEVCSGQQPHDQNRNENTFLCTFDALTKQVEYFNLNILEMDESLWKEQFQDITLTDVPDNIFIDVLKLASKCVKQIKKHRPDSVKLLSEVKDIYKRNTEERIREEGNLDSLSTSLQIDSRNTILSCYPSTDNESQPEVRVAHPAQEMYESAQQKTIRLQQQQILDQFHSQKETTKLQLQTQSPLKSPLHHHQAGNVTDLYLPVYGEDTVEMRNNADSGSPILSFPPNAPIPVAFLLQAAYDKQPERKKIDRLSGLSQREDQLEENYPSDPNKLQKIDEFENGQQNSIPRLTAVQPGYPLQDHFPQADPKKMAQLNSFDEDNFGKSSPTEKYPENLECDPAKIAYLQSFDDGVYKKLLEKDCCSDTDKTTASEATSEVFKKENLTQITTAQQLPNLNERLSNTPDTSAYNRSLCGLSYANPGINENECVGFMKDEESHISTKMNFECVKYSPNNNVGHQPSDDSTQANEWPGNSNIVRTAEETHRIEKPGKQKIMNLFEKYSAALQNLNDEDSCDTENEETN